EISDRTEFNEVRPNRDERPFRARIGPEAQSQRFAWGTQSPLKTRLFPRRVGRLSVFATGIVAVLSDECDTVSVWRKLEYGVPNYAAESFRHSARATSR